MDSRAVDPNLTTSQVLIDDPLNADVFLVDIPILTGGPSPYFWTMDLLDVPETIFTTDALPVCGDIDVDQFTFTNMSFSDGLDEIIGTVDFNDCFTSATSGAYRVTLVPGQIATGLDFGNVKFIPLPDGDDIIFAGGGNDDMVYGDNVVSDPLVVSTGTRSDTIYGQDGNDTIFGQEEDDRIWGADPILWQTSSSTDVDTIDGGEGNDRVLQTVDADQTLTNGSLSGQGDDSLTSIEMATLTTAGSSGRTSDAELFDGSVILIGGPGDDTLLASMQGAYDDQLFGNEGADLLKAYDGDDQLDGGPGDDQVGGAPGLLGGPGRDTLTGGIGNDVIDGGDDDDLYVFLFSGLTENDVLVETTGIDTLDFSAVTVPVTVDLSASPSLPIISPNIAQFGGQTVATADASLFENVYGGVAGDSITGNAQDNLLVGNDGQDTLIGLGGDDTLIGNAGDDTLTGGTGSDTYFFADGWGVDKVVELNGEGTLDTLDFNEVTTATDLTFYLRIGSVDVTDGDGNGFFSAANEIEHLVGGQGDDTFIFSDGATLAGGTGTIDGGPGTDTLDYSAYTTPVTVDLGAGDATGLATGGVTNVENVIGGSKNDTITGSGVANVLEGGGGHDILVGLDGDDTLRGDDDRDLLIGGNGTDIVKGGPGQDILISGRTTYEDDLSSGLASLLQIRTDWTNTAMSYSDRVTALGAALLKPDTPDTTVFKDDVAGVPDTLTGGTDLDWFFKEPGLTPDDVTDLESGEVVDLLTQISPLGGGNMVYARSTLDEEAGQLEQTPMVDATPASDLFFSQRVKTVGPIDVHNRHHGADAPSSTSRLPWQRRHPVRLGRFAPSPVFQEIGRRYLLDKATDATDNDWKVQVDDPLLELLARDLLKEL